jgi:hypothetical protein
MYSSREGNVRSILQAIFADSPCANDLNRLLGRIDATR